LNRIVARDATIEQGTEITNCLRSQTVARPASALKLCAGD
jgi:hypothetical protein